MDGIEVIVTKLSRDFSALSMDYWGPNKDNGRRSEIAEHERRIDSMEAALKHYIDAEREKTCIGKQLLAEHEKEHKTIVGEETEMRKTKENNRTLIIQQWVQIAGLIIVALIGLYGK
jgi:hypothetical protein